MHPPGRAEIVNPEKAEIVYDGPGEPALKLLMPVRQACPYRKSNPDVLMVQTSDMAIVVRSAGPECPSRERDG
jgi:hypothetical protein